MRLIDADALAATLDPLVLVEALRAAHRAPIGQVERVVLEDGEDASLTWAAWQKERGVAIKAVTVFPRNARQDGPPNIQSVVLLFDPADGSPRAVIHGESFTRMKTAADSALAADILAAPAAHTLAVLGAGGQAETHVHYLLAVRPTITRVLIWNRSPGRAEALAARLSRPGLAVEIAAEAAAAVGAASLVATLTAATVPVLRGDWLRPGTHVDLVGGYLPGMRESDDAVACRGRLFADSHRFGVMTCGDYAQPIAAGIIPAAAVIGDLFDLCTGRVEGRRHTDDITVCKNGGGGHLDLMVACALLGLSA